jgi:hypothetical protein
MPYPEVLIWNFFGRGRRCTIGHVVNSNQAAVAINAGLQKSARTLPGSSVFCGVGNPGYDERNTLP